MKRLVLVGGGHAHLPVLAQARALHRAGAAVTLIAPAPYHYYSGMGPGLLAGTYHPDQARINVAQLATRGGAEWVAGTVAKIDAGARSLTLVEGGAVPYDLVSFNTGSRVPIETLGTPSDAEVAVKPIEQLIEARKRLLAGRDRARRVLVVGGGPAGVEVAANVAALARDQALDLHITLTEGGDRLLGRLPRRAGRIAHRVLAAQGVEVRTGCAIASLHDHRARTASGKELAHDLALVTIGIVPHSLYATSGLPTAPDNGLRVDRHLQALGHPEIFGGGDCIALEGDPLPRLGVYAIRQGRILSRNLIATLRGTPLRTFRPQRHTLLILNLGDGTGLVMWGPWAWRGRLGFTWKNFLDTRFIRRFQ